MSNINPKKEHKVQRPIKYGFKLGELVNFEEILRKIKEKEQTNETKEK